MLLFAVFLLAAICSTFVRAAVFNPSAVNIEKMHEKAILLSDEIPYCKLDLIDKEAPNTPIGYASGLLIKQSDEEETQTILTCAHFLKHILEKTQEFPGQFEARCWIPNRNTPIPLVNVLPHPDYKESKKGLKNDIGLAYVEDPIENVPFIDFSEEGDFNNKDEASLFSVGYGTTIAAEDESPSVISFSGEKQHYMRTKFQYNKKKKRFTTLPLTQSHFIQLSSKNHGNSVDEYVFKTMPSAAELEPKKIQENPTPNNSYFNWVKSFFYSAPPVPQPHLLKKKSPKKFPIMEQLSTTNGDSGSVWIQRTPDKKLKLCAVSSYVSHKEETSFISYLLGRKKALDAVPLSEKKKKGHFFSRWKSYPLYSDSIQYVSGLSSLSDHRDWIKENTI